MKNYFPLQDTDYLNVFLGKHSSISLTEHDGKSERTVHLRRLDRQTIELDMHEWDGLRFVLQVKFKDDIGCLIEPKFQGDTYERLYVEQAYRTMLVAISDTET